ncbi:hypothetical protein DRP04_06390 [Archaeoglobales archaeon]|nr:MAG: hypothetical protein DRP04_06390 [Archaeoglobales archaeon]
MPSVESAVQINLQDATFAVPSDSYGEIIVIGEDPNKTDLFNIVKTYYSQSEVEADFGTDSPIAKATAKIFAQGVSKVSVVNVVKYDATAGTTVTDYDTVLADLAERADYDIIVPTIGADDSNIAKLIDHAGANKKVLVIPFIGSASDAITAFGALTVNEFCFGIAHDDSSLTEGELAGAVAGVIGLINPWTPPEWHNVQGINAVGYKSSEVDQLEQNNINTVIEVGKPVISSAKTLDGGWIDIPRTKIYLATEIKNALVNLKLKLANMNQKIPYTPAGIQMIKATIENVLRVVQRLGAIREDYTDENGNLVKGFEVSVPDYDSISDADKAARILRNVRVTAYLSGAISKIVLDLVITL